MVVANLGDALQEFYFYKKGMLFGFQKSLFDLIGEASIEDKENLRKGFPHQVKAFEKWMAAYKCEKDFFEKHGLTK